MTDKCIYCGKEIVWLSINGQKKPFDDPHGSSRHHCGEFKQNKISLYQRVSELEDKVVSDHNLIVKLISKINKLEQKVNSV